MGMILGAVTGVLGAASANSAANKQSKAADKQLAFSKEVYADQKAAFAPYLASGTQGQQAYNSLLGLGKAPDGFTGYEQTPGYQFALNQGLDAAKSGAMLRGGLGSGSTLQALNDYGAGMANQGYETYLNRLQGIGAQGQAAAGGQAGAAAQYGQNGLAAMGSKGDAQAAGVMGGYNALTSGLNSAIGAYGYMQANPHQGGWSIANLFGGMAPRAVPGGASGAGRNW